MRRVMQLFVLTVFVTAILGEWCVEGRLGCVGGTCGWMFGRIGLGSC